MVRRIPVRALARIAVHILAWLFLLFAGTVAYLMLAGFPSSITLKLAKAASSGTRYVEVDRAFLALPNRIVLKGARLFRRGAIGPALMECDELTVAFGYPGSDFSPARWVRGVGIRGGVLRDVPGGGGEPAASAEARQEEVRPVSGQWLVEMTDCDLYGLKIQRMKASLGVDQSGCVFIDLDGRVGPGEGEGAFQSGIQWSRRTGRYAGTYRSDFNPSLADSMLKTIHEPGVRRLIAKFDFAGTYPVLTASFRGRTGVDGGCWIDGNFAAEQFSYNGVPVIHADTPVFIVATADTNTVTLDPLRIKRPEGEIETTFVVNSRTDKVTFEGTSTADPVALAELISRGGSSQISELKFGGPARVVARGWASYTNSADCLIDASVEAKSFGYAGHTADTCFYRMHKEGGTTIVSNLDASVYGGRMTGLITLSSSAEETGGVYSVSCKLSDVACSQIAAGKISRVGGRQEFSGKLSCEMTLAGVSGEGHEDTINGQGSFRITQGHILRLPFFGGLSGKLASMIPGVDRVLKQTDASAGFNISNGIAHSDDLRIEGDVLSLMAKGDYDLAKGEMDYNMELRFLKDRTIVGDVVQTILLPMSKLFKVRLLGTLEDPRWNSVNF